MSLPSVHTWTEGDGHLADGLMGKRFTIYRAGSGKPFAHLVDFLFDLVLLLYTHPDFHVCSA